MRSVTLAFNVILAPGVRFGPTLFVCPECQRSSDPMKPRKRRLTHHDERMAMGLPSSYGRSIPKKRATRGRNGSHPALRTQNREGQSLRAAGAIPSNGNGRRIAWILHGPAKRPAKLHMLNSYPLPLASSWDFWRAHGAQPAPPKTKPPPERPFLTGGLLVKVQIAPAAKSTLTDPLFVWHLYDGGRQAAWGTALNKEEAAKQAEAARSMSERRGLRLSRGFSR